VRIKLWLFNIRSQLFKEWLDVAINGFGSRDHFSPLHITVRVRTFIVETLTQMPFSINIHLDGKMPIVRDIYHTLINALSHLDGMVVVSNKTSIHLNRKYGFAGVYTRNEYLLVHIHLDRRIEHSRFVKIEQISRRRYKHSIKIESIDAVNPELVEWLEEAYALKA
jgi:hypothetical protein